MRRANAVSVFVWRPPDMGDGAGGLIPSRAPALVAGSPFEARLVRSTRREDVTVVDAAPARVLVERTLLVFERDADVRPGDVCEIGQGSRESPGVSFSASSAVRRSRWLHVDVERVR